MAAHDYHLVSHWRVQATCEEVCTILGDTLAYPDWWQGVFLEVRPLPHNASADEAAVSVLSQGFLPYALRFEAKATGVDYPHAFGMEVTGDFLGHGTWSLRQEGEWVHITFDWRVRANKRLIRALSWLLKPLFAANHRWAMRRGEEGLRQELARRVSQQGQTAAA